MEPKYCGAMEQYVNLGAFYDAEALRSRKREIMDITRAYKACYTKAYNYLSAAGQLERELYSVLNTEAVNTIIKKRIKGIVSREMKKKAGRGKVAFRFLSAFTYEGIVCRFDTVEALCERVCTVDNAFGFAPDMLSLLADAAVENGYDIILCKSPTAPDKIAHIMIPELSLAYISQSGKQKYIGKPYKHIRLDALADRELLRENRDSIRAGRKLLDALYHEGWTALADAKTLHDKLEAIYNPYVDFSGVDELAEEHIKELAKFL